MGGLHLCSIHIVENLIISHSTFAGERVEEVVE